MFLEDDQKSASGSHAKAELPEKYKEKPPPSVPAPELFISVSFPSFSSSFHNN